MHCKICMWLQCVCLLGIFPSKRSVARNSSAVLDKSVSAVPSFVPMLSLRTCHTVTDHTVKDHTVFEKYLACLGMLYEVWQDVASCREYVMYADLASCVCSSRGRECTSEEHSCSQLPSTPLGCSRETDGTLCHP